jgi:hypothetical protein
LKENKSFPNIEKFKKQVDIEIEKGLINPISAEQLFINIIALNIFPFVAKPLIMAFTNADDKNFKQLMEDRKTEVANFIINSIKTT